MRTRKRKTKHTRVLVGVRLCVCVGGNGGGVWCGAVGVPHIDKPQQTERNIL